METAAPCAGEKFQAVTRAVLVRGLEIQLHESILCVVDALVKPMGLHIDRVYSAAQ